MKDSIKILKPLKWLFISCVDTYETVVQNNDGLYIKWDQNGVDSVDSLGQYLVSQGFKITKNTMVSISFHGKKSMIYADEHSIQVGSKSLLTEGFFVKLQSQFPELYNISLYSCHSGLANKAINSLKNNSILINFNTRDKKILFSTVEAMQPHFNLFAILKKLPFAVSSITISRKDDVGNIQKFKSMRFSLKTSNKDGYITNLLHNKDYSIENLQEFLVSELERFNKIFPNLLNEKELEDLKIIYRSMTLEDAKYIWNLELMEVTYHRNIDFVKFLLSNGVDASAMDDKGNTALTLACQKNNTEIVKLLLGAGASGHLFKDHGDEYLTLACKNNNTELVKLLLEAGASAHLQDSNWIKYLNLACDYKNPELVKLLLEAGASAHLQDSNWTKYLSLACKNNDLWSAEFVLKHYYNVNMKSHDGAIVLMYACVYNSIGIVRLLLEAGASEHIQGADGALYLRLAHNNNDEYIVKLLLEAGVEVNAADNNDGRYLILACDKNNVEIVKLLCAKGANVNVESHYDTTLLTVVCCCNCDEKIVALLLENGAEVNARNNSGDTVLLSTCAENNNEKIVELLLKNGAEVNAQNNSGDTALRAACKNNHTKIVELLLDHGAIIENNDVAEISKLMNIDINIVAKLADEKLRKLCENKYCKFMDLTKLKADQIEKLSKYGEAYFKKGYSLTEILDTDLDEHGNAVELVPFFDYSDHKVHEVTKLIGDQEAYMHKEV